MEGCPAEDDVGASVQPERKDVSTQTLDRASEFRLEVRASPLDHLWRDVDGDHAAVRDSLEQKAGQTAAAAAGIQDGLTAAEPQPIEQALPPLELRVSDAVVALGVPTVGVAHRRPHPGPPPRGEGSNDPPPKGEGINALGKSELSRPPAGCAHRCRTVPAAGAHPDPARDKGKRSARSSP